MSCLVFLRFFLFSVFFLPVLCYGQFTDAAKKVTLKADKLLAKNDLSGLAISVSYLDTIIYSKGFGYADIANNIPVDPSQTKFRIGSITKTLTVLALTRLAEQNKTDLDKSIYYYLDSLPRKKYDITLRQLAGHNSGLKRDYLPFNTDSLYRISPKEVLNAFKGELTFAPGTAHSYSNYGYDLLGIALEKIAGKPYSEVVESLVLKPLGMSETYPDAHFKSKSKYYTRKNKVIVEAPYMGCNLTQAAGYYYSTSEDLVKMGNALLIPGRLLKKESLLEMIKPQKLANGKTTGYGLGIEVHTFTNGNKVYGHQGAVMGGKSFFAVYPKSKLVIAILCNSDYLDPDDLQKLMFEIEAVYSDEIGVQ
jgi:serine beta-lactamase-like protein LACTB